MAKRLAVFCGSKTGHNKVYQEQAAELAAALYHSGTGLVYGGGRIGLMGVIADRMMELGGEVIGVIPQKIKDMEVAHTGITQLHVVDTMHERKALMAARSDGFIALPGGIGTMEEIIEVFTWLQLGYHDKPCGFLNTAGYFDPFFKFLDHAVSEGFFAEPQRNSLLIATEPAALVAKMLHPDS